MKPPEWLATFLAENQSLLTRLCPPGTEVVSDIDEPPC